MDDYRIRSAGSTIARMGNFKFSVMEFLTVLRERWREPAICIPVGIVIFGLVFFTANQAWDLVDHVSAMWESPKPPDSISPPAQPKLVKLDETYLPTKAKHGCIRSY